MSQKVGEDGVNKKSSANRELAGGDYTGMDVGTTGCENGGADDSTELPGADDNTDKGNAADGRGNQAESAIGSKRG